MVSRVLVPVDGSRPSRLAFEYAVDRFPTGYIIVLHVVEPFPDHTKAAGGSGDRHSRVFEERRHLLDQATKLDEPFSGQIETELLYGRPVHVIPRYIELHDIDQVVMGSHGRDGATRLLLGSVAETVVRRSPVPVTVVRLEDGESEPGRSHPVGHVLVPFDRSFSSRNALEYALTEFPDARVSVLYVREPLFEAYERIESLSDFEDAIERTDELRDRETDQVFRVAKEITDQYEHEIEITSLTGDPSRCILEWIDSNEVDQVVIGTHGRDGITRLVLGSCAETVVRRAPVPVTVVP